MHARLSGTVIRSHLAAAEPRSVTRSCDRLALGHPAPCHPAAAPSLPRCSYGNSHRCGVPSGHLRSVRQWQRVTTCQASEEDSSQHSGTDETVTELQDRMKATMSGLDALLGIDPEEEERKKREEDEAREARRARAAQASAARSASSVDITVDNSVLDKIRQAEAERDKNSGKKDEPSAGKTRSQWDTIIDLAKRSSPKDKEQQGDNAQSQDGGDEDLSKSLKEVFDLLRPAPIPQSDVDIVLREVFKPSVFYVTSTLQAGDIPLPMQIVRGGRLPAGILVRGTLRVPREDVFGIVYNSLRQAFGERYEVFLVPDIEEEAPDPRGGVRVAFQVLTSETCRPEAATSKWQWAFAVSLALLTAGSCLQLGLVSNIQLLPQETIKWLANPDSLDSDLLAPGLENFDIGPLLSASLPIAAGAFGIQVLHDLAHRATAALRKVKLGPSFFIPNGQIGSFGGVTPFRSMVRTRSDLFDVSVSGPAAAGAVSAVLFLLGLSFSAWGSREGLVPVPPQLFQGSLALGSMVKAVLGDGSSSGNNLLIHPLLIAGWAGLVSTALNLLPVGSIDGGRMVQGAFGRSALALTSFFTYVGLGLGFLGSSLALPFGLVILILQRDPETCLQDQVTPPSSSRQVAAAALILAAVLVLLPLAPDLADTVDAMGPQSGMFL